MAHSSEDDFADCTRPADVFAKFRERSTAAGVRLMSVIAPLPLRSVVAPDTYVQFWGYDPEWYAEYSAAWQGLGRIEDLILEYGAPILWRDIESRIPLNERNRQILSAFHDYHGRDGICMPLFGPYAFQTLLSFALEDGIDRVDEPRVLAIAEMARQAQRRFVELSRCEQRPQSPLSAREQEVLQQIALGRSKKMAARELGVSLSSIDTYLRRIFTKLEVNDRTEAVVRSLSLGLIKL